MHSFPGNRNDSVLRLVMVKFRRIRKAVSPVIAVLLMIAIAVIAAILAYMWVTGYIKFTSTKTGKAIQIQSASYTGTHLLVYVQNVGQGTVRFIAGQCLYVDGVLQGSAHINPSALEETAYTCQESETVLVVDKISLTLGQTIKIKVVTDEGTFIEKYFTINAFAGEDPYSLVVSVVGQGSVSRDNDGPYDYGDVVQLTANPATGWDFSVWGEDLSGSANPATITINGLNTVTATFTQNEYALTANIVGSGSVSKLPDQATYHLGDSVQLTATADPGWSFSGWSEDLSGSTSPAVLIIDETPSVTATFTLDQYQVSFRQNGASIANPTVDYQIDGGTIVTETVPFDVLVSPSSQISYTYQVTISGASGTQQVLTGVNPTSPQTITGLITITGSYQTQYLITVTSDHDTPTTSAWVTAGQNFDASVTSPDIVSADHQWVCTGYSIDGGASTPSTSFTFTDVQSAHTIVFDWNEQYYLTVSSSHGTKSGQGWYNSGDTAYAGLDTGTVSGGTGTQYVFTSWGTDASGTNYAQSNAITMDGPKTATANWQTQYYLTVTSAYGTAGGESWYNSGATPQATVSPLTVPGPTDTQYVFTQWSGDASGTTSPSDPITMNAPKTATANWKTQYRVQFAATPPAGGSTTPSAPTWYDAGSSGNLISASANAGYAFSSWSADPLPSITFANPLSSSTTMTINAAGTITATFTQDQYTLTMYTVGQGSVTPGNSTAYHYGDVVQLTASPANGWSFQSWSSPPGGSASPASITISSNTVVTATFIQNTPVSITFTSSGIGGDTGSATVLTIDGTTYNQSLLPHTFSWTIGSTHSVTASDSVSAGSGKRYKWVNWTNGDGLSGVELGTYTVPSSAITVTVNYKTQWKLTLLTSPSAVGVNHITAQPSSSDDFYDDGTSVALTADDPATISSTSWYDFNQWSGDVSYPYSSNPKTVTMNRARTVTANYGTLQTGIVATFYQSGLDSSATGVVLTVEPDSDNLRLYLSDLPWTEWEGAPHDIPYSYSSIVSSSTPGKRFVLTSVTGQSSPVTSPGTVTGNYKIQYQVSFAVSPGVGGSTSPTGTNVWEDAGSLAILATANPGYTFSSWTSTGSITFADASSASTTATIDGPGAITANFVANPSVSISFRTNGMSSDASGTVVTIDSTPYTYAELQSISFNWPIDSTHSITASTPVSAGTGKGYIWTSWSALSFGISTSQTYAYTVPSPGETVTANYGTQYYLTIISPDGTNPTGQGWYDANTQASSSVTSPVTVAGPPTIDYTLTGYTGTGDAPSSGSGTSVSFTINQPSAITWHWHGLMTIRPNSDSDTHLSRSSGSYNYRMVYETSSDQDGTYVYDSSDGTGYRDDTYDLQDSGGTTGTITSVTVYAQCKRSIQGGSTTDSYGRTLLRSSTTVYGTANTLTDSYQDYSKTYTTRPEGGAWSWTYIDSLEAGASLDSRDTSGTTRSYARCTMVWVVIDFNT
jgi:flagellin-like protein